MLAANEAGVGDPTPVGVMPDISAQGTSVHGQSPRLPLLRLPCWRLTDALSLSPPAGVPLSVGTDAVTGEQQ